MEAHLKPHDNELLWIQFEQEVKAKAEAEKRK